VSEQLNKKKPGQKRVISVNFEHHRFNVVGFDLLVVAKSDRLLDSRLFMMVATICASYAFMLPIATPPNAIAMSSGVVTVKMMARYGVVFNFLGIAFITLFATLYWQYFLI